MIHSSMLVVTTDGERLTCGGFSLDETIHFGSLEFIINCFGSLSFSPKENNSSTIFVETVRNESPSLCTIIEDSIDEFYMTSSGEGNSGFPISRRCSMGTPPTPITTTPWSEDAPPLQTITTVLS
jgi:hypothetical protein